MAYVTTVIAPFGTKKLDESVLAPLVEMLHASPQWLSEREACDFYHDAPLLTSPRKREEGQEAPSPIDGVDARKNDGYPSFFLEQGMGWGLIEGCDIITQPTAHRRKRLLVCDMDSTLIEQECIDELADYLGLKDQVAAITERAMNGELEFKAALRARVALLKGLPEHALQVVYDSRITLMPGGRELAATMQAHGGYCLLVSGGFTFFTERVRAALGFDADQANDLEIRNGTLTGRVMEPILDKHSKHEALQHAIAQLGIAPAESMAIGDGANDLPMLQAAGLGVAYHAKPVVRDGAHAAITHADLRAALYVQGYTDEQISG